MEETVGSMNVPVGAVATAPEVAFVTPASSAPVRMAGGASSAGDTGISAR